MSHVISIDIGTSGIKVGALNRSGELVFILRKPYELIYPQRGWVEIDANDVWEKTKDLLHQVHEKIVSINGNVDAIGLSTFCNASVFMDEYGDSLCRGIMYLDHRSEYESNWIKANIPLEKQNDITRNRIEPGMFSVTTLLWTKWNRPDIWKNVFKWGHLSTYILHRLTKKFVLDWTQASFSGVFDVINYEWSEELLATIGIDYDILPKIIEPSQGVGVVCDESLPEFLGVHVVAGGADTACSALAVGIKPDDVFESVGTSDVLTVCTTETDRFDNRFLNRCHIFKNQWLSHGAMSTPGASIKWFLNNFLDTSEFDNVERMILTSQIGANGLFFLPYMFGERTPVWDKNAAGAFVGLSLTTTKADMLRAILEGCSYGLSEIYEIIRQKYRITPETVPVVGGGARNSVWAQMKASVLNVSIAVQEVQETALLGAGLLAGSYAGYFDISENINRTSGKTLVTFYPRLQDVEFYAKQIDVYTKIYPALRDIFTLQKATSFEEVMYHA
ncbi:xylulokinase [Alicyclobacillus fastidiosus]|uniref:FGGY family carbohydrate kinase n=1 Tax=Alicyclobacillus fastidiosus TaxID=392011 RepID=A0ABV5ABB9_9BACL|nr:FGGY family carbohydrate kinase [Alicyclobacillus fastidiosus]WEH10464.1 FGGY family carbohydrate kinase [Alicyclobacillus fastidiosus]